MVEQRGRCLNPQTVECSTLATANRIRHKFQDCIIQSDDSRRKTVAYCGDAPQRAREAIGRIAYQSHQETNGYGQQSLSRFERRSLDFERTNVFHARACKAIAATFEEDDWIAYYDHSLTVSEHEQIYQQAGGPTARTDGPTMREVARGGCR